MIKILVVDDDPDILEAIQLILSTGGYDSATTTKGEETYERVKEYEPDIIILDVLLSGNDGRTICQNLKRMKETTHIPVIMISAHPTAKESVKKCGADGFVAKPFSVSELLDEINKFI